MLIRCVTAGVVLGYVLMDPHRVVTFIKSQLAVSQLDLLSTVWQINLSRTKRYVFIRQIDQTASNESTCRSWTLPRIVMIYSANRASIRGSKMAEVSSNAR